MPSLLLRIGWLAAALVALPAAAASPGERRIEGRVLDVKVTLCQMKPKGCAGYFTLESGPAERRERNVVQVRLGVPIQRNDDYVLLGTLAGSTVSVAYVVEKRAIIARSIAVRDGTTP